MDARRLLFLSFTSLDNALVRSLRAQGWDIKQVTGVEELADAQSRTRSLVGLVVLDDSCPLSLAERLPRLCPVEWLALAPAEMLKEPSWAALLANNFYDYHTLPADLERLSVTLGHALGRCQLLHNLRVHRDWGGRYGMVGRSPPMQSMFARMDRIIKVDAPVLITGESGTGKELVARAIHEHSSRRSGPFVAVNCGGLAENLIQSELFGHERGAFTGALQRKTGSLEAASGGIVFLDEIGDLPLALQANLLRFLQEKSVTRVGSTQPVAVDVRVLAATHVDLNKAVEQGRFREDLYYRLNVVRIEVPALRQRGEDIELLAHWVFQTLEGSRNARIKGIGSDALEAMRRHPWQGNVRELMNRMQQAVIMGSNRLLTPQDLDLPEYSEASNVVPLSHARQHFEREVIRTALENNRQNVSKTARELGVSRVTLYRLFEKFDIERP